MTVLAERLRYLRFKSGVKQFVASQQIGVHKQSLCRYEKGTKQPTIETLVKLAKYYQVSTDYLLGLVD